MGIKYIHVTLIVVSIALFLGFGGWSLAHAYTASATVSLGLAVFLVFYCIKFIKSMKVL